MPAIFCSDSFGEIVNPLYGDSVMPLAARSGRICGACPAVFGCGFKSSDSESSCGFPSLMKNDRELERGAGRLAGAPERAVCSRAPDGGGLTGPGSRNNGFTEVIIVLVPVEVGAE